MVTMVTGDRTTYLWLQVPVDDALVVHEVDGGHKFAHDVTRLELREAGLAADAVQQLPTPQQVHHDVRVQL